MKICGYVNSQNLSCFHFQGQDRELRVLEGRASGAFLALEQTRKERDQVYELLEKIIVMRQGKEPRDGMKRGRREIGEVRKYRKSNESAVIPTSDL